MRFSLLFIILIPVFGISQSIFVKSYAEEQAGWVASQHGETLFTIPAGWKSSTGNDQMAIIEEWPLLFLKNNKGSLNQYALLHEDGHWQALEDYASLLLLSPDRLFARKGRGHGALLSINEEVILDTIAAVGHFLASNCAIASKRESDGQLRMGLIDKKGNWVIEAAYARINYLKMGRFLVTDSLDEQYLFGLNQNNTQQVKAQWDTILPLSKNNWQMQPSWHFDSTGHSWLRLQNGAVTVININGQQVSDTLRQDLSHLNPFTDQLSWCRPGNLLINTEGQFISGPDWEYVLPPAEKRIAVKDTASGYFGYLNAQGSWAIEPAYCYATGFRDGLAVTAGKAPDNCSSRISVRTARAHLPAALTQNRRVSHFELIDTFGQVVWADSCRELFLLPGHIVGRNNSVGSVAPATRIDWLKTGQYWLSPDYYFTQWSELREAKTEEVIRLDIGSSRYNISISSAVYPLPADFAEGLARLNKLEVLRLNYHKATSGLPAVFEKDELKALSLVHCGLEVLPKGICQLKQLTDLDLSHNPLKALPACLYRMRHLHTLNITGTELPPDIIPRLRKALPDTEIIFKRRW